MRSLFHFPFPCTQPPSQQPSPTATVPLQPEMSHRPHPAPVRHRRRSPALLSAVRPLPALIAPPPPEYRPAAARTHWARLVHIAPTARRRPRPPLALRRPRALGWQESHRMHPFFAECAKKAPFLAASARNACSSRSEWQHPRPMHPFPGAIGRFRIHGARILPPRALFRVEEPEITHGAKMLPAPPGLSATAACGPAGRALRPALALRRPRPATRSPYRCISPPARRTHPASRAHPPRPGNKRNSTNNSMRA